MSQVDVIDPIGEGFRTYLLKVEGNVVASARTSKAPTGGRLVSDVWTSPKHRGQGYSKRVLNTIFGMEPRPLKLRVGAYGDGKKLTNEQLKEYYNRLGFTKPEGDLLVKAANCDPDTWTSDQAELVERLMRQGVQMDKQVDKQAGRLPWQAPLPVGPMNDQPIVQLPWWRARPGEKTLGDVASDVAGAGRKVVQVARNLVPKFQEAPMARGPYTPNSNRVDVATMTLPAKQASKEAVVRRKGKKWQLWTADGSRVLGTHDSAQDAYKQEYAIQKSKDRAAKSAALQSPQTVDALSQLMEAKRESDRRNYKRKHSILRRLIEDNPDAFSVDSMSRGIAGLTHNPTGFRLHMPGTAVPAALAEKQAVSRWRTPDGLRILAPNSVTRLGQLRSAMERLGLTNPYSNSDAFPGLTRALAASKYAPLSTHVDILDEQKIVNDMLRGGKLYRAHVARDPFKGITAGVPTAYASASPAVAVYGSNGGVGLGSGDYKILSTFSEAPDQVHRGQLQAERWLTRKELGRTASGFRRKFPTSWVSSHMYETPISADRNRLMSQLIIRRSAHNIHNIEATPATRKLLSVFKSLEMPDKQFEVASRVAHGWKPIQAPARAGGSAARKLLPALLTLVSRGRMRIKMAGASSTNQLAIELGPIDWKKEKVNPFLQHASGIIGQARIPQPPPVAPPGYTTQALHQVEQNLNWLGRKITGGEAAKFREYYGLLPQPTRTALDNSTAALSRAYWDAGKTNVPPVEFATRFNKLLPAEMRPPAVGEAYKTDVRRAAELVRGNMEKSQAVERVPQKKRRPWWLAPVGTMAAGYGAIQGTNWLVPRQAYRDIKPFADAMLREQPRGADMSLEQAVRYGDEYLHLGSTAVNARIAGGGTVPDVVEAIRAQGPKIEKWVDTHPTVKEKLSPAALSLVSGLKPLSNEGEVRHYREFQNGPLAAYLYSQNEYNPEGGDKWIFDNFAAKAQTTPITAQDTARIRQAARDYVNMFHRGPDNLDPVEISSLTPERQAELLRGFRLHLMVSDPELFKKEQAASAAIGAHRSTQVAKQYGSLSRAGVNIRRAGLVLGGLLMAGGGYMMVRKIQQMRARKEEERKKKARPQLRLFPGVQAKAASFVDTLVDTVGTVSVPTNGLYNRGYASRALEGASGRLNPIKRLFVAPYIEHARAGYETLNPTARMHMDTAASNVARRYGEEPVSLRTFIEEVQGKLPPVFQHPAVERASGPKGTNAVAAARVVNGLLPSQNPRPSVWTAPRPQSMSVKSNSSEKGATVSDTTTPPKCVTLWWASKASGGQPAEFTLPFQPARLPSFGQQVSDTLMRPIRGIQQAVKQVLPQRPKYAADVPWSKVPAQVLRDMPNVPNGPVRSPVQRAQDARLGVYAPAGPVRSPAIRRAIARTDYPSKYITRTEVGDIDANTVAGGSALPVSSQFVRRPVSGMDMPARATVDASKFLADQYGGHDNFMREAGKADAYAAANGYPINNRAVGSMRAIPVVFGPPAVVGGTSHTLMFPSSARKGISRGVGDAIAVNGLQPGRPYYGVADSEALGHELAHIAAKPQGEDRAGMSMAAVVAPNVNSKSTYPEIIPAELAPPGAAIQRWLYAGGAGRRLESPEAYDQWIGRAGKLTEEQMQQQGLPSEVQRWLRYRNTAGSDTTDGPARVNYLDSNMRRLIPALAQAPAPQTDKMAWWMKAAGDAFSRALALESVPDSLKRKFQGSSENANGVTTEELVWYAHNIAHKVDNNLQNGHAHVTPPGSEKQLEKAALTLAEVIEAGRVVPRRMSMARRASGNYRKGIVTWNGLRISIETPAGHWRIGKKEDGKLWFTKMRDAYGYIQRHEGYDGDAVDVFLGPDLDSPWVHVVNQTDGKSNTFDEVKCVIGCHTEAEARLLYMRNYTKGWRGYRSCVRMSVEQFKNWLPKAKDGPASHEQLKAAAVRGAALQLRGAGAQKLAAFLAPLAISAGGLGTDLITNAYSRRAADRMARALGPMPREEKALLDLQTRLRTVPVKGLHSPAYISYRDIENRMGVPLGEREPEEARRRGMVVYDPKTTPTAYYAHELGHADVPVWARSDKFTPRALTAANVFSYFPGAAYGAWSGRPVAGAAVGALGRLIGRSPVIVEEYFAMRRANQMIDALPGTPEDKQAHKAALMRAFLTYVIPPVASGAAVGGAAGLAGMLKGK